MSYNGSGSAREVVRMIALALGFKIHEDEHGISAYGGNAIRIADHCTYMQTWVDNGTWNAPIRLDVVIEEKPTQAVTQVKKGFDFTISEFVYDINDVDPQNARTIAYDIRNVINGNQYANNARGERKPLKSTHTSNENKQYNNNRYMKRTIKLTESDLHDIIKESVKNILKENYDVPEFDNVDNSDIEGFNGNYTEVTVPDYCLPYLVNGTTENYDDEELNAMQEFESKWNGKLANGLNIGDVCVPLEGRDPSFTHSNDVFGNISDNCYRFLVPLS